MSAIERITDRRLRILLHVRKHGPTTAREIARDVLGGTGGTRKAERSVAQSDLLALVRLGELIRYPADLGGFPGYEYAIAPKEGGPS